MRRPIVVALRTPLRSPVRRPVRAVIALLALAGCVKGDAAERGANQAAARPLAAASPAASPAGSPAGSPAAASLPGALTQPLAKYDANAFYTFTRALRFGGGADRVRKCKGNAACSLTGAGRKQTKVRIDAVDGQDSISVNALPANGVVAIRARNTGSLDEARYGMKAGGTLEYYLVVLPGTHDKGVWRLMQLDTRPNARALSQVATGAFTPCNHTYHKPGSNNRANFYTCADSHYPGDTVQTSGLQGGGTDSDPIWFWCAEGCCLGSP